MTFVLSLVSIALTPLALEAIPQATRRNEWPVLILIANIALYIALPLCTGLLGVAPRAENTRLHGMVQIAASTQHVTFPADETPLQG